jgi:hypothetical protein
MLSANHYEGLLESALKSMKELRSIHSSTFAFNISNYLASTHRNEASHLDRRYGDLFDWLQLSSLPPPGITMNVRSHILYSNKPTPFATKCSAYLRMTI